MFKVNNKDTKTTPHQSCVFIVNLFTSFTLYSKVSNVKFEQVNAGWDQAGKAILNPRGVFRPWQASLQK